MTPQGVVRARPRGPWHGHVRPPPPPQMFLLQQTPARKITNAGLAPTRCPVAQQSRAALRNSNFGSFRTALKTEPNVHGDALCFMVKTWATHKTAETVLKNCRRLVAVGSWRLVAVAVWLFVVGGGPSAPHLRWAHHRAAPGRLSRTGGYGSAATAPPPPPTELHWSSASHLRCRPPGAQRVGQPSCLFVELQDPCLPQASCPPKHRTAHESQKCARVTPGPVAAASWKRSVVSSTPVLSAPEGGAAWCRIPFALRCPGSGPAPSPPRPPRKREAHKQNSGLCGFSLWTAPLGPNSGSVNRQRLAANPPPPPGMHWKGGRYPLSRAPSL